MHRHSPSNGYTVVTNGQSHEASPQSDSSFLAQLLDEDRYGPGQFRPASECTDSTTYCVPEQGPHSIRDLLPIYSLAC